MTAGAFLLPKIQQSLTIGVGKSGQSSSKLSLKRLEYWRSVAGSVRPAIGGFQLTSRGYTRIQGTLPKYEKSSGYSVRSGLSVADQKEFDEYVLLGGNQPDVTGEFDEYVWKDMGTGYAWYDIELHKAVAARAEMNDVKKAHEDLARDILSEFAKEFRKKRATRASSLAMGTDLSFYANHDGFGIF